MLPSNFLESVMQLETRGKGAYYLVGYLSKQLCEVRIESIAVFLLHYVVFALRGSCS